MNYNFQMLLILVLILVLFSCLNAATVSPNWLTSLSFRANSHSLIVTKTGPGGTNPNYLFTFSQAFSSEPYLSYGLKSYRGDDFLLQQCFKLTTLGSIDGSNFQVQVQIQMVTNIWLLEVIYIAVDSSYNLYMNTFRQVSLNYSSGPLVNITTGSNDLQYFAETIDYSNVQTYFSSTAVNTFFSAPYTNYQIIFFLTSLNITSIYTSRVQFDISYKIINQSYYTINVTLGYNATISVIAFSQLIYDKSNYSIANNNYAISYDWTITNTLATNSYLQIDAALQQNFIMGLKQFKAVSGQCALQYRWNYLTYNIGAGNVYGIQQLPSIPVNNTACGLQSITSSVFYYMKWTCPSPYIYFDLATRLCSNCLVSNCQNCLNTTFCAVCMPTFTLINGSCYLCPSICTCGGYVMPRKTNGDCSALCGDGIIIFPYQTCDDGNINAGDGCSSTCTIEDYSTCNGQPSTCYLNHNIYVNLVRSQVDAYQCNTIRFVFGITPSLPMFYLYYINWTGFVTSPNSSTITQSQLPYYSNNELVLTYTFSKTIQRQIIRFNVEPNYLLLSSVYLSQIVPNSLTYTVYPSNNIAAVFCDSSICTAKSKTQGFGYAMSAISYVGLFMSIFSCKIIGLQMFGVLQLSYFSLSDYDFVNPIFASILGRKQVNGLNIDGSSSNNNGISSRVVGNGFGSQFFLSNFNLMLLFSILIALAGLGIYTITYYINNDKKQQQQLKEVLKQNEKIQNNKKNAAPGPQYEKTRSQFWHRISKYLLKQVLLTFMIFNMFNLSFSAGIQIKYIHEVDSFSIICLLISFSLVIVMIIAQVITDKMEFGQFMLKFKQDKYESKYMIVTLIYRFVLGLLMALLNQWIESGVVFIFISACFMTYLCYFDPFQQRIHNLRTRAIHGVHILILFVNFYYRLQANYSQLESSTLYFPAYLMLIAVGLSVIGSTLLLGWQFISKIKHYCEAKQASKQQKIPDNSINSQIEEKPIADNQVVTIQDIAQ